MPGVISIFGSYYIFYRSFTCSTVGTNGLIFYICSSRASQKLQDNIYWCFQEVVKCVQISSIRRTFPWWQSGNWLDWISVQYLDTLEKVYLNAVSRFIACKKFMYRRALKFIFLSFFKLSSPSHIIVRLFTKK